MKYYTIDENTARTAHNMVHMSDYKPGSATADYKQSVDSALEIAEEQKKKVSPYYHEKIDALLDSYSRRLANWYNDYNRNQAKYPSQFICGAGGFNMKKHNAQMARENTLWAEYDEIKRIPEKIKSIGTGPVDLNDPHAEEILSEQLQKAQRSLETAKAINAYYRKHKTFTGFPDMTAEQAEKNNKAFEDLRSRLPYIDKPYPDYELTSIRGKVKRIEQRIEELHRLKEAAQHQEENAIEFCGGEIIQNAAENRLQIIFDDIPDVETRDKLKSNGFRWSPKNKAWQRILTDNAIYAAKRILAI